MQSAPVPRSTSAHTPHRIHGGINSPSSTPAPNAGVTTSAASHTLKQLNEHLFKATASSLSLTSYFNYMQKINFVLHFLGLV